MNRRVDAHLSRTQFGQIMDRAVENNERFVVERRGEPAVVILSVQDFNSYRLAAARLARKSLGRGETKRGRQAYVTRD